jgi:NTE family protein
VGSHDGQRDPVGLVLAGGGARGAYEIGALSALLPELDRRGERPRVIVGTSVGALNAAYLAATAERTVADALADGEKIWLETGYRDVLKPLLTLGSVGRGLRFAGQLAGLGPANSRSMLDPEPLEVTLKELIPIEQLGPNLEAGRIDAAAVVATSAFTSRTVVFRQGGASPARDRRRGIDYVPTSLEIDHVRASAAIPAIFPAVRVTSPPDAAGWYFDGGTRLNTPIKPALELGAKRVIVIALDSTDPGPDQLASDHEPDIVEGIGQFLQAVLVDPMVQDVHTLAGYNQIIQAADGDEADGKTTVPYILIAPERRGEIGEVALAIYKEHYRGFRAALRSRDLSALARMVDGGADPVHGGIMSMLFFAPEFAEALLALGRRDAQRWLAASHEDGPWDTGPPGTG